VQTEESPKQSKYKKFTPVLLVILVVGFIGLGLLLKPVLSDDSTHSPQANAAVSAAPIKLNLYQAQIAISSRGFTPISVKVKKGDSVAWIRKDGSMHLIVSDSGPATFKGQGALQFNDMYLTTFNTVGTYTYHDQLNPSLKGTVIVE
jgi:plastocyanin